MKRCAKCGDERWDSNFPTDPRMKDGLSSWCRACNNATKREWAKTRCKVKQRSFQLAHKYGITLSEYEALLHSQSGVCAICFETEAVVGRSLAVDHDHTTGAIRGLLCGGCNTAIGLMKDSTAVLSSAIRYLSMPDDK